jgi:hypothetical protein
LKLTNLNLDSPEKRKMFNKSDKRNAGSDDNFDDEDIPKGSGVENINNINDRKDRQLVQVEGGETIYERVQL